MRQRFAIILTVAVVLLLLVVLNAASYVSVRREMEAEFDPDRSTYNPGATGTRALYDLLAESGRPVTRWSEDPFALQKGGADSPSTFVIVGKTRAALTEMEARSVLKWVENGGRLVLIDRRPDARLLPKSATWSVSTEAQELPKANVSPAKPEEMTAGVAQVRASQPSPLTRNVEFVQPSRYAGAINISEESLSPKTEATPTPAVIADGDEEYDESEEEEEEPPPASPPDSASKTADAPPSAANRILNSPVPIAHLETHRGALLIDYPHGLGRIIVLSDPYLVANGGIRLADNLQLALNVIAGSDGLIAFDEFHQKRVAAGNRFFAYFAGTPVIWMLAQGLLIVLALLWTSGRRFARPLPVPSVDRRSSLEFVASMAELQQRARAFDLAIENIYIRLRRVLVRYAGLSHNSSPTEIAAQVAARSSGKLDSLKLETLMRECEDAINGAPLDGRKSLELVKRLREVERTLGLRLRSRETRQAAEGLQQNSLL
jgi:hypothetical protein